MERRRNWHYVNRPLDDTRQNNARNLARSDPVSGLLDQQLVALVKILGAPGTPAISAEFFDNAREIANRRVAQSGYRLADLLRELFSKK